MLSLRRVKDRKAVSEVFTVILMLAIVAVAGISMVQMGLGAMLESGESLDVFYGEGKDKILEKIIVDDVWFNNSNQVYVSVINVGRIPVNITTVSFNETDVPVEAVTNLGIDQSAVISVEFSWSSGEVYRVGVMSDRGNIYESNWKA